MTARPWPLAACLLLAASPAPAYVLHDYRWDAFPVVWYLDETSAAESGVDVEELEQVFTEAFAAWARAEVGGTCTAFRAEYGGRVAAPGVQDDRRNVLSFLAAPAYPGPPNSFALTVPRHRDGRLVEVDLVLHLRPDAPLAVEPGPDEYDLLGIVIHELGHLVGVDHTDVQAATMYGVFPPAGDTSWRTLEADDLQAMAALYPQECGEPCVPGGCEPGERCHPQTERCEPDPACEPPQPPERGCATGGQPGSACPAPLVAAWLVLRRRRREGA